MGLLCGHSSSSSSRTMRSAQTSDEIQMQVRLGSDKTLEAGDANQAFAFPERHDETYRKVCSKGSVPTRATTRFGVSGGHSPTVYIHPHSKPSYRAQEMQHHRPRGPRHRTPGGFQRHELRRLTINLEQAVSRTHPRWRSSVALCRHRERWDRVRYIKFSI